ncbi:MAG: hypothetical protein WBL48_15825, partial [Pseudolabrys sp.]
PARPAWRFSSAIPSSKRKTGLTGSFETCGIIAERLDLKVNRKRLTPIAFVEGPVEGNDDSTADFS